MTDTHGSAPKDRSETDGYRQVRFLRPKDATELVLVRHGESAVAYPDEPFPLVEGQGDPPLAPEGRVQARKVAERLAGTEIAAIYVTNLRRTAETAEPLAKLTGITPRVEAELREVHLGEWEGGLYRQRVLEHDPLASKMLETERWDTVPGAESNEAFASRLTRAVSRIAGAHRGERVVVFSHGGSIGMILALATGARAFSFTAVDNAAISTLVVSPERWVVRSFNDVAHLEQPAERPARGPEGPPE